ncbi:hypothetical protein [Candidatus Magnetominusculus dajiuhuensis]|uniref:hypothetical protein n=1 Tax=Candidatus Magnetominusculus dajiuhuensis TaxID=3137712 RepID=UPI003B42BB1C
MEQVSADNFLIKAIDIPQLCEVIHSIMERYNVYLGVNVVVVVINCLDEQCTTVIDNIKHEMRRFYPSIIDNDTLIQIEKFYNMRLLGGIFLPKIKTYESLLSIEFGLPADKTGNYPLVGGFRNSG